MRLAPARVSGTSAPASDFVQTVLFTDNERLIEAERDHVYNKSDLEEGLVIFDNGQRLTVRRTSRTARIARVAPYQPRRTSPTHRAAPATPPAPTRAVSTRHFADRPLWLPRAAGGSAATGDGASDDKHNRIAAADSHGSWQQSGGGRSQRRVG